jgi:uroporphyrinogen III methyltransferase/synthase
MSPSPRRFPATVYLVGAGPGDPGLLTLRGAACLRQADVVLYDYLVNPIALEHASAAATLVPLGHHKGGRALSPDQITAQMVEHARAGRTVVRLKGGDPSVFGRGADETAALRAAGIPFEIVPGITTGLATAAYCEIPITHQDDASALALIAARERDDKTTSLVDYAALAGFPGTMVFYMGVGRAADWSSALIAHGRSASTPVAIVRWATRADQEFVRCTLGTVVDVVSARGIQPPAVFVVGEVVDRAPEQSWFSSRPLFGVRVLVPGSPITAQKLRERLTTLGADVVLEPVIRITQAPDRGAVDRALERIAAYDWLVFSSANGVDALLRRLHELGGDTRRLGTTKLAAIGSGTADRLAAYGLRADLTPEEFVAESLADALKGHASGRNILLVRASRGRDVLAEALTAAGATVEQVAAYGSIDVEDPNPDVAAALAGGTIDWITITSSSAAHALVRLYGDVLRGVRFASIGPIASATLRTLGHEPATEAAPHTTEGLVEAIVSARTGDRG